MTMLDLATAFTSADLQVACSSLQLRPPLGLAGAAARHGATGPVDGGAPVLPDSTVRALAVLAAPEAIAIVDHVVHGRGRTTYVAVHGPNSAVHRIRGDHHIIESLDAERARVELLNACGLDVQSAPATPRVLDITLGAFHRMTELVAVNDIARAAAALEGEGVDRSAAVAIAEATRRGSVHVLGLKSVGHRYVGCELSWIVGRDRWLVPAPARAADTGAVAASSGTRFVRARIAAVSSSWLTSELEVLFD